ncbi:hypothetical protein NQ317_015309 [Molorchus minor]|uniref:Uncharacterized protein n=1 Tax=Molorchus minor TaxID=1323400 RepID=A0ABQ9ISW7_9CUCU|nr:hypothetical protein NQ317_015309 [Molorchus minor]
MTIFYLIEWVMQGGENYLILKSLEFWHASEAREDKAINFNHFIHKFRFRKFDIMAKVPGRVYTLFKTLHGAQCSNWRKQKLEIFNYDHVSANFEHCAALGKSDNQHLTKNCFQMAPRPITVKYTAPGSSAIKFSKYREY